MTYAPINVAAYVASYSGAIAGMGVSGPIVNPTQGSYDDMTQIAGAFAQAFDIAWNDAADLNNLEQVAITAIVQNEFAQRGPSINNPTFKTVANWTTAARACVALVLESDAYFAGQGINPGTGGGGGANDKVRVTGADDSTNYLGTKLVAGANVTLTVLNPGGVETLEVAATGGGGGSVLPLSNAVFVDKNGSGAAPDGSIANPFTTIGAAVAGVQEFGNSDHYTIYCTPYDYQNEELITLPDNLALTFIGLDSGFANCRLPNMACPSFGPITFQNCSIGHFTGDPVTDGISDTTAGGASFIFRNADCYAIVGNASYVQSTGTGQTNLQNTISGLLGTFAQLNLYGTSFADGSADIVVTGAVNLNDSNIVCQSLTCAQFTADNNSNLSGDKIGGTGYMIDSSVGGGTWTGLTSTTAPFEFRSMRQMASMTINCDAGAVAMDSASMAIFAQTPQFTTVCSTVNTIATLDSETQFTSGPDAAHTYNMSAPNHVIVSEDSLTVNRVYKLNTTGGINKQLFIIDNYGNGLGTQLAIQQDLDSAVLYTFTNPENVTVRATFRVLSQVGNTFELFSVEKLNG